MTESERLDADQLMRVLQARIRAEDNKVGGFNVGSNCGDVAGRRCIMLTFISFRAVAGISLTRGEECEESFPRSGYIEWRLCLVGSNPAMSSPTWRCVRQLA